MISPPAATKTSFYPVLVQENFPPLRGGNVSSPPGHLASQDIWTLRGVISPPHHPPCSCLRGPLTYRRKQNFFKFERRRQGSSIRNIAFWSDKIEHQNKRESSIKKMLPGVLSNIRADCIFDIKERVLYSEDIGIKQGVFYSGGSYIRKNPVQI